MQLPLDTHALLWWLSDSPRMKATWRHAITDVQNRVVVSAASIWEITIKASRGRLHLDLPEDLPLAGVAGACGFEDLPVRADHAATVAELPMHHADPFDRILIAQARVEQLTLVSANQVLDAYDVTLVR